MFSPKFDKYDEHYYGPTESDVLQDYMDHADDALTIAPSPRLQKKVQELESERLENLDKIHRQ